MHQQRDLALSIQQLPETPGTEAAGFHIVGGDEGGVPSCVETGIEDHHRDLLFRRALHGNNQGLALRGSDGDSVDVLRDE